MGRLLELELEPEDALIQAVYHNVEQVSSQVREAGDLGSCHSSAWLGQKDWKLKIGKE